MVDTDVRVTREALAAVGTDVSYVDTVDACPPITMHVQIIYGAYFLLSDFCLFV